jgi:ribonuclease HI
VTLKKSELLEALSKHLSVERLLSDNPGLTRESISVLFKQAAAAVGPGVINKAPAPAAAPKRSGAERLRMFTDGASRGNPGEAGIGILIEDESGHILKRLARYLGKATNNQAEYTALIDGLKAAAELGAEEVSVFADSELVVKQMKGEYKVKNADLQEKHGEAKRIAAGFKKIAYTYIPREKNREADALANEAIDKRL